MSFSHEDASLSAYLSVCRGLGCGGALGAGRGEGERDRFVFGCWCCGWVICCCCLDGPGLKSEQLLLALSRPEEDPRGGFSKTARVVTRQLSDLDL